MIAEHMLLRGMRSLTVAQPGEAARGQHRGRPSSAGDERDARRQRQAVLRRTVYVRNLDAEVTEVHLLHVFGACGGVQDSRLCSDPHSTLRYAFLQFDAEEAAGRALALNGTVLGRHAVRVSRSRTAIVPVNSSLLPRSEEELERCKRTAYVTNLDADLDVCALAMHSILPLQTDPDCAQGPAVHAFFDRLCGPVTRVHVTRMQGQSTGAAFVEFADELGAGRALNCGGARIKQLPIRVSPSKTPLQTREPGGRRAGGDRYAGWRPAHGHHAPADQRFRADNGHDHAKRQARPRPE